MLTWPIYSPHTPFSRFLCASVPFAFAVRLVLIGQGVLSDTNEEVASMTRGGNKTELLRGPAMYGAVHVAATVWFWRSSPTGIMSLIALCVGDGIADIAGRKFGGRLRWPHSRRKSLAGTAAFVCASTVAGYVYLRLFTCDTLQNIMNDGVAAGTMKVPEHLLLYTFTVSSVAAVVETLPFENVDNLTLTAAAACTSSLLLQ